MSMQHVQHSMAAVSAERDRRGVGASQEQWTHPCRSVAHLCLQQSNMRLVSWCLMENAGCSSSQEMSLSLPSTADDRHSPQSYSLLKSDSERVPFCCQSHGRSLPAAKAWGPAPPEGLLLGIVDFCPLACHLLMQGCLPLLLLLLALLIALTQPVAVSCTDHAAGGS